MVLDQMSGIGDVESYLQNILKREIESNEVYPLEVDFYVKIKTRLSEIHNVTVSGEISKELLEEWIKRVHSTVHSILLLRLTKELLYVWFKGEKPNIVVPKEESEILDKILETLSSISKLEASSSQNKGKVLKLSIVSFSKPYSKVVLSDGRILGPFSMNDVAIIPSTDAAELERAGVAKKIVDLNDS
ncbi:MAG: hypothetical protein QXY49_02050 [Thermofilaceae archaeon]